MAEPCLLCVLAARSAHASKKLIAAVGRYVLDGGDYPDELRDLDICERFGWTLDELDRQDMSRVIPAIAAQNTRRALQRNNLFLESVGKIMPNEGDLSVYAWVRDLMKDDDG